MNTCTHVRADTTLPASAFLLEPRLSSIWFSHPVFRLYYLADSLKINFFWDKIDLCFNFFKMNCAFALENPVTRSGPGTVRGTEEDLKISVWYCTERGNKMFSLFWLGWNSAAFPSGTHHSSPWDAFVASRRHNFSGTYVDCDVIGEEHQLFALGSV